MDGTFCFVDIAGFTALTETHGAVAAADLVEKFVAMVKDVLHGDGEMVDVTGDAVFVVAKEPDAALEFLSRLRAAEKNQPPTPVIIITSHDLAGAEQDDLDRYRALHMNKSELTRSTLQGQISLALRDTRSETRLTAG